MMNNQHSMRGSERKEEKPPYSRLFVVCSKQLREEDLSQRFERFGIIEDLYIPRDRNTGESKGVAYIKYAKTSSAAAAIQEMHMKTLNNDSRPTKVMVAVNKNENPSQTENEDRYRRLFIKVHRDVTESEVRDHFSAFGYVESVHLQRDKVTDTCKGFAYVQYKTFYDAAKGFEDCDKKYKAVFATPRDDLKRSRHSLEFDNYSNNLNISKNMYNNYNETFNPPRMDMLKETTPLMDYSDDFTTVAVKCVPPVPQKCIEQLFNIVPGMVQCQYSLDSYHGISRAVVTYNDPKSAAHALNRLNNFEFPSGEIVSVRPDKDPLTKAANDLSDIVNNFKHAVDSGTPDLKQLADAIAKASTLIKAAATTGQIDSHRDQDLNFCSVNLPQHKPMVDINSRVAQRLFIICKPQPPPIQVLQDVFCRFGDLINVSTIPNKTFGFVKYASVGAAQQAMRTLNGAMVSGIRLKVLEADEKPSKDEGLKTRDNESNADYDMESKRMKLED